MYRPQFVYPFTLLQTLGSFYLLAVMCKAAVNTGVQISVQVPAFRSLGVYKEVELLGQMLIHCSGF